MKNERMTVNITAEMKNDLIEVAKNYGLNLSGYVRMVLLERIEEDKQKERAKKA